MACVFCEIVAGTAPAVRIYEDDDFLADDVIDEWEDEPWTQWRSRDDADLGAYGADEDDEEL